MEWVTHSENIRHAFDTGLEEGKRGENNWQASMTNEDAKYVRENPENLTGVEPAKKFGVYPAVISDIQRGLTYKDAGGTVRESKVKRIPKEKREQIRTERKAGASYSKLAEKHKLSLWTTSTIIHEGDG